MPWVRIDEHFFMGPKFAGRPLAAVGLWTLGLGYCNLYLTDGFISREAAHRLGGTKKLTDELERTPPGEKNPLWIRVEGGWQYHDYHDYQPTAQSVRDRKEERSRSGKKGAESRWGSDGSSHGNSHSSSHGLSHGNSHHDPKGSKNRRQNGPPNDPVDNRGATDELPAQLPSTPARGDGNSHSNSNGKRDGPIPKGSLVTSLSQSTPVDARPPDDDDRTVINQALDEVGRRQHAAREQAGKVNGNPQAHLRRCQANARTELADQAERHLAAHPNATPTELADLIHPPPDQPKPPPELARCPHCGTFHDGECAGPPNPGAAPTGIADARARLRKDAR